MSSQKATVSRSKQILLSASSNTLLNQLAFEVADSQLFNFLSDRQRVLFLHINRGYQIGTSLFQRNNVSYQWSF